MYVKISQQPLQDTYQYLPTPYRINFWQEYIGITEVYRQ